MLKRIVALLIVTSITPFGWSSPTDETAEMLARAEALYYEADFAKSVEILLRADDLLRQNGTVKEKIDVKLQLAVGLIGMNDTSRAKAYLGEVYALNPDSPLDPQIYPPKVILLANEAKAEQHELRCQSLLNQAQTHLAAGNSDAVVKLIGSDQAKCPGLSSLSTKTADLVFNEGLVAYKKAEVKEALQKFRQAVALEPKHELAAQYMDLAEGKLQVTAERALLAWHKDFAAGEFALAARDFRDLTPVSTSQDIDAIRAEYSRTLSSLVDAWNRACTSNDATKMEEVRVRINALLPEPSFGADILANMKTCAQQIGCIQMGTALALARLKTRVEPTFPASVISQIQQYPLTVRVKTKITASGDVDSIELRGGDSTLYPGIRAAMEQWKFLPAITENIGARCIETEISIVVSGKPQK